MASIWITTSEASQVTGISERTLRHQAINQKIRCSKKDGQWKMDLQFLKTKGMIPEDKASIFEFLVKKYNGLVQVELKSEENNTDAVVTEKETSEKKFKGKRFELKKLVVYTDLLALHQMDFFKDEKLSVVKQAAIDSLINVGIGFYEFHTHIKVGAYRVARKHLIRGLVSLNLMENSESVAKASAHIEKIIDRMNGLIRKIERSESEKKPQKNKPPFTKDLVHEGD